MRIQTTRVFNTSTIQGRNTLTIRAFNTSSIRA